MPRPLAALIALAGLGWLLFLAPPIGKPLMDYIEVVGFVADASLMLWLLIIGVDSERWVRLVAEPRA